MKRYIGNWKFYRETLSIALPIMAQQFITTFVNLIDNIMIGSIGNIALTSVTVANRFYIIFNSTLFGICGASGIYIAQYFGAKEHRKCQEVFNINMVWAIGMALLFTIVLLVVPEIVIRVFSNTPEIVNEGLRYLEYARFTYLPFGVTFTCMMALRAVGINHVQLKVGAIAVLTNTFLNYCLIFGNFGFPEMGVQGAAIATVIARLIEMSIYITIMYRNKHFFNIDWSGLKHLHMQLMGRMIRKAIPLTVNEILFSVGLSIVFLSYMRCDEYLVAAISVVDTVVQILFIVFGGLSSAVSILIGKKLGANELEEAKENSRKLIVFGAGVAILLGSISFIVAIFIPDFYNVDATIKQTITILLRLKSILIFFYAINVCIFFVLRSGGDIVSTLLMDSGFLWLGGVLVSTILSLYCDLPLVTLYLIVESLDIIKTFVAFYFFKKEKWVKNITAMA